MTKEDLQVISFEIILHSGDARTMIHEGFALMREGKFSAAEEKLTAANNELLEAHKAQTRLLQDYANGEEIVMEVIVVHAEDHLMTTMALREMAVEMLQVYREISQLKELGATVNGSSK